MALYQTVNSLFTSNTWTLQLASCTWLVDCGDVDDALSHEDATKVKGVLLTHAHFDHIYGLNRLLELNPHALIYTNNEGKQMLLNDKLNLSHYHESPFVLERADNIVVVDQDDIITLDDDVTALVHHTPGHNPSCLSFAVGQYLFTGDAYIPGAKVVTMLPKGDKAQAAMSVERILQLAQGMTIIPGHGAVVPTTNGN